MKNYQRNLKSILYASLGLALGFLLGLLITRPPNLIVLLIQDAAWPLAAVSICVLYRAPLSRLIDRFRKYSSNNHELEFDDTLPAESEEFADLKTESKEEQQGNNNISTGQPSDVERDELLAEIDPAAAIISSWSRVYGTLLRETKRLGFEHGSRPTSTRDMILFLIRNKYLGRPHSDILWRLSNERNHAAHGPMEERENIPTTVAQEHGAACRDIIRVLKDMKPAE